jgi:archaellum component FlaF (FlaF/FlaG flagellin family)
METIFVSIICVALMVIGGMTMSQGFLRSIDNTSANITVISQRDQDIMRTNITALSACQTAADTVEVSLQNCGQTKLASFDKWDIIVHSTDAEGRKYVTWLPYTGGDPGDNQWHIKGIYIDAGAGLPEAFEPGILNPDEEIIIECRLNPPVGPGTINLISISTPNGITVSKTFTGID